MPDRLDLLTYLAGEPGPDVESPRVGDPVELRVVQGGKTIEAFTAKGQRLGCLPPTERQVLAGLLPAGRSSLRGRISAVVPRPRRQGAGRIHIRVREG